jgi:hypothetical protein
LVPFGSWSHVVLAGPFTFLNGGDFRVETQRDLKSWTVSRLCPQSGGRVLTIAPVHQERLNRRRK